MANYFSHSRYRARDYEYSRLKKDTLQGLFKLDVGRISYYQWSYRGKATLSAKFQRMQNSVFVFTDIDKGYHIYFEQTDLTYGKRAWFICPACNRRCAVLYHAGVFACRKCVKPSYESQNGSQIDYLGDKIRSLRVDIWGKDSVLVNDLLESCRYYPKPKNMHWSKFDRDRGRIIELEEKRLRLLMVSSSKLLSQHPDLSLPQCLL